MADTNDTNEVTPGNTKSRHFTLTINNYTDADVQLLKTFPQKSTFQAEVGEQGTKHLQCVISFDNARSFSAVKKAFPRAHIEVCKRLNSSIQYCMKDDTKDTGGIRHSSHVPILRDPMDGLVWKTWQTEVIGIIKSVPDSRKIYWYYEYKGCTGKSTLAKHIIMKYKNATYVAGKSGDMLYALTTVLDKNPFIDTIIIDIPRCVENISFNALEQIKNGMIFSTKYESGMKVFNPPHVICFSNELPKLEKMSQDRWVVRQIDS